MLEAQERIQERPLNECYHHHKRPEVALDSGTLKVPELVEAAAKQESNLETHPRNLAKMTSRRALENQPNSLGSGPTSCTSRGGSGFWSMSGKSPGTGPVHPPSQNALHSPSFPMSGENRRRPSAVRSHSASATLHRVAAT